MYRTKPELVQRVIYAVPGLTAADLTPLPLSMLGAGFAFL